MYTTNELKAKLAERDALPDDLTTRLTWTDGNPPPSVRIVCRDCGQLMKPLQLSWGDVRQEIELHGFVPEQIGGYCNRCAPPDDEEE